MSFCLGPCTTMTLPKKRGCCFFFIGKTRQLFAKCFVPSTVHFALYKLQSRDHSINIWRVFFGTSLLLGWSQGISWAAHTADHFRQSWFPEWTPAVRELKTAKKYYDTLYFKHNSSEFVTWGRASQTLSINPEVWLTSTNGRACLSASLEGPHYCINKHQPNTFGS